MKGLCAFIGLCLHVDTVARAAKLEKDVTVEIGAQGVTRIGKARTSGPSGSSMMRREQEGEAADRVIATVGSAATVEAAMMKRSPLAPGGPLVWPREQGGAARLPAVSLQQKMAITKESWGRRRKTTEPPTPRRRRAPPGPPPPPDAIACEYSEWEEWDDCSKSCDKGTQKRERRVAQEAEHGGRPCTEKLHEKQDCNVEACLTTTVSTTVTTTTTTIMSIFGKSGALGSQVCPLGALLLAGCAGLLW